MSNEYIVVPDIHGQLALLEKAFEFAKSMNIQKMLFLGDYIDRGPHSKEVVFKLMECQEHAPEDFVFLLGNHEQMFVDEWDKIKDRQESGFQAYKEEMKAYYRCDDNEMNTLRDWFKFLPVNHVIGKNVFAHAYYDYRETQENQSTHTNIWKRVPTNSDFMGENFLTHGHTPHHWPEYDHEHNRLNLDIGGMYGKEMLVAVFAENDKGPARIHRLFADL